MQTNCCNVISLVSQPSPEQVVWVRRSKKRRRERKTKTEQLQKRRVQWVMDLFNETACLACGNDSEKLTLDHIVPKSKGGHLKNPANFMPLCRPCNNRKANKDPIMWYSKDLKPEQQTRHLLDRILFAKEVSGK